MTPPLGGGTLFLYNILILNLFKHINLILLLTINKSTNSINYNKYMIKIIVCLNIIKLKITL